MAASTINHVKAALAGHIASGEVEAFVKFTDGGGIDVSFERDGQLRLHNLSAYALRILIRDARVTLVPSNGWYRVTEVRV